MNQESNHKQWVFGIIIGIGVAVALSVALDSIARGIPIGIGIGLIFTAALYQQGKRKDKSNGK